MSLTYGFYNSLNGDRRYSAEQFSRLFDGIIRDGVFASVGNKLAVKANEGLVINVGTGRAWFNGTWTLNSAVMNLTIPNPDIVLDRIDTVVLVVDTTESVRENSIVIVRGEPGSEPVPKELVDDETKFHHPLAYVRVKANATEITQANITNLVGTDVCPYVTAPLESISADQLLDQWQSQFEELMVNNQKDFDTWTDKEKEDYLTWKNGMVDLIENLEQETDTWQTEHYAEFNTWFQGLKNTLSGDVAANLQKNIDETKELLLRGIRFGADDAVKTTTFNADGTIGEVYSDGYESLTVFESAEVIKTHIYKDKTWLGVKITNFNADGSITERVSTDQLLAQNI